MNTEKAILACGCFWGVEKLFKGLGGVIKTQVGYTGGLNPNPTYELVCSPGNTHYEAIEIEFDNSIINFKEILKYFFQIHDPTQTDGQHNDIGHQYKSAIFVINEEQNSIASKLIDDLEKKSIFKNPIATNILKFETFYTAELHHQDYLAKNPRGYMCHFYTDLGLDDI